MLGRTPYGKMLIKLTKHRQVADVI